MLSRLAKLIGRPRLLGTHVQKSPTPIIYIVGPESSVARGGLWVPVGAADDTRQGTAHFLEHVLTEHIAGRQRSAVSRINALTSFYWTVYVWAGDLDALENFLTLKPDTLRTISITPDIVERHRHIIQMELLEQQAREKNTRAAVSFFKKAFPGEGIHRSILGSAVDIEETTQEDLLAFQAHGYTGNGSFYVVSGPRSHLLEVSKRGHGPTIWVDTEAPGDAPRELFALWPEVTALERGRTGGEAANRNKGHDCFCAAFEVEGERHFAFACKGEAFEIEECESALAATALLQDWLMRDTPGSLCSRLKAIDAEPRDLAIYCHLTPELSPLLTGTFAAKDGEAAVIFDVILAALTESPPLESSVLQKLKERALNARFRRPMWSYEGMLRFGGEVATYGLVAAFNQKQTIETLDLDTLKRALSKFRSARLNLSLNGDI